MSSKSANYCFACEERPTGLLLLCEVALGECYERLAAEYGAPKSAARQRKHSTLGLGRTAPDPQGTTPLVGDPSVAVPMGRAKRTKVEGGSLLYNEMVVYDPRQVRQRFVLQVRFHHRRA